MAYNVFISHSMRQEDLGIVYEVARQAHARGIDCYIAERDWQFGKSLPLKIENAIRRCDCFVAFWTVGGAHSAYVNQEIGFVRGIGKQRVLVVENGVQVKGFDVDKEYIPLDRWNPIRAIQILSSYLSSLKAKEEERSMIAGFMLLGIALLVLLPGRE